MGEHDPNRAKLTVIFFLVATASTLPNRPESLALASVKRKSVDCSSAAFTASSRPCIASSGQSPPPEAKSPLTCPRKEGASEVDVEGPKKGSLKGSSRYSSGSSGVPTTPFTMLAMFDLTELITSPMLPVVSTTMPSVVETPISAFTALALLVMEGSFKIRSFTKRRVAVTARSWAAWKFGRLGESLLMPLQVSRTTKLSSLPWRHLPAGMEPLHGLGKGKYPEVMLVSPAPPNVAGLEGHVWAVAMSPLKTETPSELSKPLKPASTRLL